MSNPSMHLCSEWLSGARIVAGACLLRPKPDARVVQGCDQCPTWCIGASEVEALDRLAEHRVSCHG